MTANTTKMVRRMALLLSLLAVAVLPWLGGSQSKAEAFRPVACPKRTAPSITTAKTTRLWLSPGGEDDEDEDDGWGSAPTASGVTEPEKKRSSFETDQKLRELQYLREEASRKSSSSYEPSRTSSSSSSGGGGDRDLFIPILSVVSLMGLFGAYGYETLRLASRGELYLPF